MPFFIYSVLFRLLNGRAKRVLSKLATIIIKLHYCFQIKAKITDKLLIAQELLSDTDQVQFVNPVTL